jgi:tetratricopeptide (TPR) repeat protein
MGDDLMPDAGASSDASEPEAPAVEAAEPSVDSRTDVFVSYRVDPDQETAVALKKLIAGSIEPTPCVFVSGEGGLRPKSIGLKPQLQKAVGEARAFVAVITPASKEREWIIFEAGAAWGRGQTYAPILIDTEPGDLAPTIADFVATKAAVREQMEILISELAKTLGATVRSRFGQRYSAFERHLKDRAKQGEQEVRADPSPGDSAEVRALRLWNSGKREEAIQAFDEAEALATGDEVRADLRITRLSLERPEDLRQALDELDHATQLTACWAIWRGIVEPRTHVSIEHYRRALRSSTCLPRHRHQAVTFLGERLFRAGKADEATSFLLEHLASSAPAQRVPIVTTLWDGCRELTERGKLFLAASAVSDADVDLLRRLADLAIDQKWRGIALCAAKNFRRKAESGTALNTLGRALHNAGYLSLAYDAYIEAVAAGVSVARVNLASCTAYNAVPGAALALLKEHKGDFDSASPEYPYQIRAQVEQLVREEREKADVSFTVGYTTLTMLSELADAALAMGSEGVAPRALQATDDLGRVIALSALSPFRNAFEAHADHRFCGLVVPIAEQPSRFRGVEFDPGTDMEPRWLTLDSTPSDVRPESAQEPH